ncbi:23S rRNA pseudouridine1911/1915/1917 synthase [Lachnospiraceae bacterium]|nr:23S rRNA pseudouridine1911/1915/1917 synthase [Lachnospiraceae bacterium]
MAYQRNKLRVIFEDKDILVIHKAAGVASETRRLGEQDCVSLAKNYLAAKKEPVWIGLVHRLDQPVEGILVLAKNSKAASVLSEQMKKGDMFKEYIALVMPSDSGKTEAETDGLVHLTDYLLKNKDNTSSVVSKDTKDAKKAELEYEKADAEGIKLLDGACLYRIHLLTGRHHQIRVQMSHAGLPVIGDRKYGFMPDGYRKNLCLAARKLIFKHPKTGKDMTFEIPMSEIDFLNL